MIITFYSIDCILKLLPVTWVRACNVTFIPLLPFFLGVVASNHTFACPIHSLLMRFAIATIVNMGGFPRDRGKRVESAT